MTPKERASRIVRAGDREGLGRIYSQWGGLLPRTTEETLHVADNWEMDVRSPWRTVLPGMIFVGFMAPTSSRLYVTTERIVLIRKIDIWRELKGELTPLGLPMAAEKEVLLRKLQAMGARQYCEVWPKFLKVVRVKHRGKPANAVQLFLKGTDGRQYAVAFWKPIGSEPELIPLIESRFSR